MSIRTDGCEQIIAKINKFKLNKRLLALSLGMNEGLLSEKINLSRGNKFNPVEKERIEKLIIKIGKELMALEK